MPVVILTVGGSPRGRAMVEAHSGALAGEDAAWQAFCAATGAVRVRDLAELTDTLELFAAGRRASVGAQGIATVHDSGAERALVADLAHELGVQYAELSDETLPTIGDLLDDGLTPANPLDVWGTGADTRALFGACLRVIAEDPAVAVTALAVDLVTEYDGDTAYPDAILGVARHTDAPLAVLASVPSAIDDATAQRLRAKGIAVLEGARSGLAALGHLARWPLPVDSAERVVQSAAAEPMAGTDCRGAGSVRVARRLRRARRVIAHGPVAGRDAGGRRCDGYPVALKTAGALHKSDVGGVALGLADEAALRVAYTSMAQSLGSAVTCRADDRRRRGGLGRLRA